jgi:hypothetical protein
MLVFGKPWLKAGKSPANKITDDAAAIGARFIFTNIPPEDIGSGLKASKT